MKNKIKIILFIFILVLAFKLRITNYDKVPFAGETLDEYSNAWVGLSLIRLGIPVGGLGVGGYKTSEYRYINPDRIFQTGMYANPIKINYPWFDHPPLTGLITGGYAYLKGAKVFEDITVAVIRKPMVIIGTLSVGLAIVLGWILYGWEAGLLAGLIYAITPLAVTGSRMVQAENMLVLVFLGAMSAITKWVKQPRARYLAAAGILSGLAIWFKLSGIAVGLTATIIIWNSKNGKTRWQDLGFFLAMILPFGLGWLLYGAVFDWKTFLAVQMSNSSRVYGIGPQALWELLSKSRISHTRFLTDGWIFSGWIAVLALGRELKKHLILTAATGSYLAIYIIFGNYPYGWYMFPLIPFLCIALGKVFKDAVTDDAGGWMAKILLVVPTGVGIMKLMTGEEFQKWANLWRWGLGGILLISFFKFNKINKIITWVLLMVAIIASIKYTGLLTPDYWFKIN